MYAVQSKPLLLMNRPVNIAKQKERRNVEKRLRRESGPLADMVCTSSVAFRSASSSNTESIGNISGHWRTERNRYNVCLSSKRKIAEKIELS